MELVIGIAILLVSVVWYFNGKKAPKQSETVESAEAVKGPVKCGCGRSPTGNCVGLHALSQEQWDAHEDNPNKVVPVVESMPVVESAPVEAPVKKTKAKKPAAMKAPTKAEKAPKAEKATKEAKPKAPRKPRNLKVVK